MAAILLLSMIESCFHNITPKDKSKHLELFKLESAKKSGATPPNSAFFVNSRIKALANF